MNLARFVIMGCEFVRVQEGVYGCRSLDAYAVHMTRGWWAYLKGEKLRNPSDQVKVYVSAKGAAAAAVRVCFRREPGKAPQAAGTNVGRHRIAYKVPLPDGREDTRYSFKLNEPTVWVLVKKWHSPPMRWMSSGQLMKHHEQPQQPIHRRYTVHCVECRRVEKVSSG